MIDAAWREVERLLVVRLDNLGDVLLTTPAVRMLRTAFPAAHIAALVSPVGAQIANLDPDIDEVIPYEAPWVDPWQRVPFDPEREWRRITELRRGKFDAAVIFTTVRQSPLPAAYACYLAGIPLRLGGTTDGAGSLLTTRYKHGPEVVHEVERCAVLLSAIGIEGAPGPLVLAVPADARSGGERAWLETKGAGPRVVVHPGCSMPARTYPVERFARIVEELVLGHDARVMVTGGLGERPLLDRLNDALDGPVRGRVGWWAEDLPFPEFCGLIASGEAVVTNNTGPMHVAAAVGTPVVSLFALTNPPEQWRPWSEQYRLLNREVPCRVCFQRVCPVNHGCLLGVEPDEVVAAVLDLLRSNVMLEGDVSPNSQPVGAMR